ncbi:MAG: aminotransferase class IV [Acidobacteria bacterium]|nr:aminotransferase class IV [Acidobacteriota bacterium]
MNPADELFYDTFLIHPDGRIFLHEAHLGRNRRTAHHLGFGTAPDPAGHLPPEYQGGLAAGRASFYARESNCLAVTVTIRPLEAADICPAAAWVALWRPADPDLDVRWRRIKSRHNADVERARRTALAAGYPTALLADVHGRVGEFCIGNLVLVEGTRLVTPPLACGVLPGVMRHALLTDGDPVVEVALVPFARLLQADGVFLTNALRLIVPVRELQVDYRRHVWPIPPAITALQRRWRRLALAD